MTRVTQADVVIVGGGLLGLSTAWALRGPARRVGARARHGRACARRVARADAHLPAGLRRRRASSRWRSAPRSRWRALEADAGEQLLYPTPQLTFGPGADAVFDALDDGGRAGRAHHRRGDRGASSRRSPVGATRCWRRRRP